MKHLKRFIVLAMVLGIGGILLMRVPATQFRGQDSQELTRHYNLIKAKDINSRTISLYSDDRKVETDGNDQIWMSDDMTLMIPETMVNDLFQCTAARMDGDIIKLIKGQKTCEIDIQKNLLPCIFISFSKKYFFATLISLFTILPPSADAQMVNPICSLSASARS